VEKETDTLLRELLCEYLGILPDDLSSRASSVDGLEPHPSAAPDQRQETRLVPLVRSRVVPAGRARGQVLRTAALSPYETRLIVEDALRAGPGAKLAVELADVPDASVCNAVRDQFASLARRGVQVRVRCDRDECRHGTPGAAA
jgi:hypothetical protein